MGLPLPLPVGGQPEDAGEGVVPGVLVEAHLHVLLHRQVAEEPDVLEGPGHAHVVELDGGLARRVPAVHHDGAPGGLVDLGQEVEHGGLPRAVGPDEPRDLRAADGHVEVVHRREPAEVDAQVAALQDGPLVHVPLGDDVGAGDRHQLGLGIAAFLLLAHLAAPPFFFFRRNRVLMKSWIVGLLVASMTRISTTA